MISNEKVLYRKFPYKKLCHYACILLTYKEFFNVSNIGKYSLAYGCNYSDILVVKLSTKH